MASIFCGNSFAAAADNDTLKGRAIVIELGATQNGGDKYLYVGDKGKGEIQDIDPKELAFVKERKDVTVLPVGSLTSQNIEAAQHTAAVDGANLIMDHYGVYSRGGYGRLPFDLEHPEKATSAMLPQIKGALQNIRADIYSGLAPEVIEGEHNAQIIPKDDKTLAKGAAVLSELDRVYDKVSFALDMPSYRADMTAKVTGDDCIKYEDQAGIMRALEGTSVAPVSSAPAAGR
ncbi:MAG: hypothetical protein KDI13_05370 [Alphaproteobacteria bacterium]|nr:hypothetical protein [Alphaproteobacteria bacterium]